ncbi:MAG: universal stress protein [Dehalococcoidia bacterium]|nr:universal stress protein [Dehalococcoidia bacterium]
MYRTILLTNDGSEIARAATPHAVQLASMVPDATIVCVTVIDTVAQLLAQATPSGWGYDGGRIAVESAEAAVAAERADADATLTTLKASLEAQGVKNVRTAIIEGHAGTAIVDAATAEHADIVVMATHGRGGLGRAVLGSVADHVVRHAPCPVLLVRPPRD